MIRRVLMVTVAGCALVALALAVPAAVGTHSAMCDDTTQYVPPDARESTSPVYLAIEEELVGHFPGGPQWVYAFWVYEESNGVTGLQRHDLVCGFEGVDESNQDRILW